MYQEPGSRNWMVRVRVGGATHRLSTGTDLKSVARIFEETVSALQRQGREGLLRALVERRVTMPRLREALDAGTLDQLERSCRSAALAPLLEPWRKALARKVVPANVVAYGNAVDEFLATLGKQKLPPTTESLTPAAIRTWLDQVDGAVGTIRRRAAALSSFCRYLVELELLESNPCKRVSLPPPAKPREQFLELEQVKQLLAAVEDEPRRVAIMLCYAAGLERSVVLKLRRKDVGEGARTVLGRGTKTATRQRVARVAEWARPTLERYLKTLLPEAKLFPGLHPSTLTHTHLEACKRLGLEGYRLHDARRHWGVRFARAGAPLQAIASQLGHANTQMASKVYAKYRPDEAELDKWERLASVQDKAKEVS